MLTECCIKGCDKPVLALGMCVNHWRMNKKYGSPVAKRPLSAENRGLKSEERFFKSVKKIEGQCWLWQASLDRDGYGVLEATIYGIRTSRAHRFSLMFHTGEVLDNHQLVMHACDNPQCVNPDHLSSGTAAENTADMMKKGRHVAGRVVHARKISKLSEEQVRAILIDPREYAAIAADYGIHKQHVLTIKARRTQHFVDVSDLEIVRNARGAKGEARSKNLTEADVRAIRASSLGPTALGREYGVSAPTICDIRTHRSWKHVA